MANLWPGLGGPQIAYISQAPSEAWQQTFPRRLVILGSTGSIGCNALQSIRKAKSVIAVTGLAAGRNIQLLARQAGEFCPPYLAVQTDEGARELKSLLPQGYRPEILVGREGYIALAGIDEATTVLSAQSGAAGLAGTLSAALKGRVICLANKESLVLAGRLVRDICSRTGAVILPVDSEHNAIFQCLAGVGQDIESLVLTASGGPFRDKTAAEMAHVTIEEALNHPNWKMGKKITIDSATMMNKGLEVIEAFHLYGVDPGQIEIVIHPQSVVHSMVRLRDGALLAQLAVADMKLPITHCLLWPTCFPAVVEKLDFRSGMELTFKRPDPDVFPCLGLARRALTERGGMCVVLNAANEAAVELFLAQKCTFMDIPCVIEKALDAYAKTNPGHEPFCPPLGTALSDDGETDIADVVWKTEKRIRELEDTTRRFVHACLA